MLKEGLSVVLWKGFYLFFFGVGHRCTFGLGGFSFSHVFTFPQPSKKSFAHHRDILPSSCWCL